MKKTVLTDDVIYMTPQSCTIEVTTPDKTYRGEFTEENFPKRKENKDVEVSLKFDSRRTMMSAAKYLTGVRIPSILFSEDDTDTDIEGRFAIEFQKRHLELILTALSDAIQNLKTMDEDVEVLLEYNSIYDQFKQIYDEQYPSVENAPMLEKTHYIIE